MSFADERIQELLQQESTQVRERLREILIAESLRIAKEGEPFILASGQTSSYYIDGRKTTTHPEGLYCVARLILEEISGLRVDAVGGPTLGADPMAAGVALLSHLVSRPMPCFLVRKETKEHGTRSRVEGTSVRGKRVAMVEDVITTGGSVLRAIQAVRDDGAEIVKVIAIIDREQGGRENFEKEGLSYHPFFTLSDLLS